ncbi:MAG: ABC transporter permease [Thermoanaerobaculia bacterium]
MRKLFAIFKREYLQTVRKKSFIILTVLMPFLMAALMLIPGLLISKSFGEKRVAVLDGTGRLREAFEPEKLSAAIAQKAPGMGKLSGRRRDLPSLVRAEYVPVTGDPKAAAGPYLARMTGRNVPDERKLEGVLVIPGDVLTSSAAKLTYYSRSSTDLIGQEQVADAARSALTRLRLAERGIEPAVIEDVLRRPPVEAIQISRSGEEKKGGELNFIVGFIFAALLFIPMLIYGVEIMRGIVQEKTERIVEILISSMSPMQLLGGKVLGLAAVGLTQISVWMAMGGLAAGAAGVLVSSASGIQLGQFLRWSIVPYFLIFYLLGYMIYVCVYAVGGAITNSEKEAQQATTPAMIIIMIPWFLLMPILLSPDSRMSTVLSLIPFFTPITMFIRVLVSEPPFWQIALSIVLTVATIYGMFWAAAKIFRVGILSYGKRPTIPELWRWMKVA